MKVEQLQKVLVATSEMYQEAGNFRIATELETFIKLLKGYEQKSIDNFVAEVQASHLPPPNQARPQIDPNAANRYADLLLQAGTDQAAFNATFAMLKSDRTITKPLMDLIANRYLNEPSGG